MAEASWRRAGGDSVRLRDLRSRQRRAARRAVGAQGQDQAGLAAPRADRRAHGGRVLPRRAPAGRDADLDRTRLLQPGHGDGLRVRRLLGASTRSPPTCRPRSSTAARSRRAIATRRPSFRWSLRPYVKRSFQPTRVDMLPLALRQSYNLMLTGRPGPVNLDVPFNLFQEEDDVEIAALGSARRLRASRRRARGRQAGRRHDSRGASARPSSWPRRDARRGRARADASRRDARHPGHHLAQRHGRAADAASLSRSASSAATAPIRPTRPDATAIC